MQQNSYTGLPSRFNHLSCDGGRGIYMSNAKVELFDVALKGCTGSGLFISRSTSATTVVATSCEFANSRYGAVVYY